MNCLIDKINKYLIENIREYLLPNKPLSHHLKELNKKIYTIDFDYFKYTNKNHMCPIIIRNKNNGYWYWREIYQLDCRLKYLQNKN